MATKIRSIVFKINVDPYNPLGLPAGIMRVKMQDGWSPSSYDTSSLEFTQVSSSPNIWDITVKKGSGIGNWGHTNSHLIELMGFNPEGVTGYGTGITTIMSDVDTKISAMRLAEVTSLSYSLQSTLEEVGPLSLPNVTTISGVVFGGKRNLRYIELTDLNNLEVCTGMFSGCTSLTTMPILTGLESLTNVQEMFANCTNMGSGILDMYNRLSNMSTITNHNYCFSYCGQDSVTGAAELAQIPSSWGGTGA